jgi:dTDP-4-dehydrorhamnose reductase
MKVLVLGANGLLGNAVYRLLGMSAGLQVRGTLRNPAAIGRFAPPLRDGLIVVTDLESPKEVARVLDATTPDVVVNCLSLAKADMADPMKSIARLAALPQRIAQLCGQRGARFVHVSSDGVFSGTRGRYREEDVPDANDIYGLAKLLGEVRDPHTISLRTSIIGPDPFGGNGLLEWFLKQQGSCRCYTRAIFSGFPTVVLARTIRDRILPRPALHGVYHIASEPIPKFDLLALVARRWDKRINLIPDDSVVIDRSLVGDRFQRDTGFVPAPWPELVDDMHSDQPGQERT